MQLLLLCVCLGGVARRGVPVFCCPQVASGFWRVDPCHSERVPSACWVHHYSKPKGEPASAEDLHFAKPSANLQQIASCLSGLPGVVDSHKLVTPTAVDADVAVPSWPSRLCASL